MSDVKETRTIHLPTYLKVVEQMPGVSEYDIWRAGKWLKQQLGDQYTGEVTFHRGFQTGDGKIHIVKIFQEEGKPVIQKQFTVDDGRGFLPAAQPRPRPPAPRPAPRPRPAPGRRFEPLADYVFGALFGIEEFSPQRRKIVAPVQSLFEGASELYECVRLHGGDLAACQESAGAKKIAAGRAAHEKLVKNENSLFKACEPGVEGILAYDCASRLGHVYHVDHYVQQGECLETRTECTGQPNSYGMCTGPEHDRCVMRAPSREIAILVGPGGYNAARSAARGCSMAPLGARPPELGIWKFLRGLFDR